MQVINKYKNYLSSIHATYKFLSMMIVFVTREPPHSRAYHFWSLKLVLSEQKFQDVEVSIKSED